MKVKVGRFLSTKHPVVLERQYAERLVRRDQRLRDPLGRDHDRLAFLTRKIEQRSDVSARDNATLADFELRRIDHGERMLTFIDDRPSVFAGRRFTKIARVSYGKFNQVSSPLRPNCLIAPLTVLR
nr:hypothetical protein [Dyella sp. C9]